MFWFNQGFVWLYRYLYSSLQHFMAESLYICKKFNFSSLVLMALSRSFTQLPISGHVEDLHAALCGVLQRARVQLRWSCGLYHSTRKPNSGPKAPILGPQFCVQHGRPETYRHFREQSSYCSTDLHGWRRTRGTPIGWEPSDVIFELQRELCHNDVF